MLLSLFLICKEKLPFGVACARKIVVVLQSFCMFLKMLCGSIRHTLGKTKPRFQTVYLLRSFHRFGKFYSFEVGPNNIWNGFNIFDI